MNIVDEIGRLKHEYVYKSDVSKKAIAVDKLIRNTLDKIWICNYEIGHNGKKVYNCKPTLAATVVRKGKPTLIVEYKKNGKELKAISSGVEVWARYAFEDKDDCVNMYNNLVKFEYKKAKLMLDEIEGDFIDESSNI